MREEAIRVLIVEDHQVVAEGLAGLINGQQDMEVAGFATSVVDSISQTAALQPDLVLMDFHLSDGTGADAVAGIRRVQPDSRVIFLTREDGDGARLAALEAGAGAFIHKSRAAQDVLDAIRTVAGGGSLFTPRAVAKLLDRRRAAEIPLEKITPREKEVLRLMALGTPSRDIAGRLGISYSTVRAHIRSLGGKLGVHSKLQAIVRARELGLVE